MKTNLLLLLVLLPFLGHSNTSSWSDICSLPSISQRVQTSSISTDKYQTSSLWTEGIALSDSCPVIHYNGGSTNTNFSEATEVVCVPHFTFGCGDGDQVGSLILYNESNTPVLSHLNTGCSGDINAYNNFLPIQGLTSCVLIQGEGYWGYVSVDNGWTEYLSIWIDFNNDGIFSFYEGIGGTNGSSVLQLGFSFYTPTDITGWRKMRVIASFSPLSTNSSCISGGYGETHDYYLYIASPEVYYSCGILDNYLSYYTATDDTDPAPVLSQSPPAGTVISEDTIVTITAIDFNGNIGTREIPVIFSDVTAPQMICNSYASYTIPENECAFEIDLNGPIVPYAQDNCGIDSIWHNFDNASFTAGVYVVYWTSADFSGNQATCSTTLEILDSTPISFVCPENTSIHVPNSVESALVEVASPNILNGCSDFTILNDYNNSANATDVYPLGTTTVEYQLITSNNTSLTCETQVTVAECCQGDLNCDMNINVDDLITLLQFFGCINDCPVDVFPDGIIDVSDIQVMVSLIDTTCND